MLVTLFIYFFALLCLFVSSIKVRSATFKISVVSERTIQCFFIVVCILIFGLRYNVGTDYPTYENIFYKKTINYGQHLELIFSFLNNFLSDLGLPYFVMTIVIECIKFLLIWRLLYTTKLFINKRLFYFFYFVSSFLFLSLNIQRHSVAVLFFMQAIPALHEKKIIHYILWIVVGAGFHYSILILLPFYFIYRSFLHISDKKYCFMLIIFVSSFIFQKNFYILIGNIVYTLMQFTPYGRFGTLLFSWNIETTKGIGALIRFLVFLFIFIYRKPLYAQYGGNFEVLFFLAFVGNFLSNIFSASILLSRLYFPFVSCNIILYTYFFEYMKRKRTYFLLICYYSGLVLFILYFIGQIYTGTNRCSPFQFVFYKVE